MQSNDIMINARKPRRKRRQINQKVYFEVKDTGKLGNQNEGHLYLKNIQKNK